MITLKDILEKGYGIDFSTLKFEMRSDLEFDNVIKAEILKSLAEDAFIVDGDFIKDFDIYGDEPGGYIELYKERDVEKDIDNMIIKAEGV